MRLSIALQPSDQDHEEDDDAGEEDAGQDHAPEDGLGPFPEEQLEELPDETEDLADDFVHGRKVAGRSGPWPCAARRFNDSSQNGTGAGAGTGTDTDTGTDADADAGAPARHSIGMLTFAAKLPGDGNVRPLNVSMTHVIAASPFSSDAETPMLPGFPSVST